MDTSLQKADIWKRISAFLCDTVCVIFLSCSLALLLTFITGLNSYAATMDERRDAIIQEAGYNDENPYPTSQEDVEKLSDQKGENGEPSQKEIFEQTEAKIRSDEVYSKAFMLFVNLSMIIVSGSLLVSFLIFEFLIPLLLKNGQTLGKKVFGVAVMRADGVKLPATLLFLRSLVCKYTLETMVPVMAIFGIIFLQWWITAAILILGILALQIILFFTTKEHSLIHDICTYTVTVDMSSQKIFNSPEEKAEYIARVQREIAEDARGY